jgi:Pyruvate:ferredoxin oxidoreductase and related 2-oxoacid:ferredoxin oxidoreductases, alpha subunit
MLTSDGLSTRAPLGGALMYYTGDEHNEMGHISEDPENRLFMYEKRMKKLETADREIPEESRVEIFGETDSKNVIVTWGFAGSVLEDVINEGGIDALILQLRMFSPFPTKLVSNMLSDKEKIIVVEGNYLAQASKLITMFTRIRTTNYILKWNGRPFLKDELESALRQTIKEDLKKVVLNGGRLNSSNLSGVTGVQVAVILAYSVRNSKQ